MKQTKGRSPSASAIPTNYVEEHFCLAFEDLKTSKSKKLELKRVNPRLFPTHSARGSEWAKVKSVLKSGNSVFERNQVDSGHSNWKLCLDYANISRHVGLFGELGRACRTNRGFSEIPPIAFNFMFYLEKGFVTFGEKPEFMERTRRLAEGLL
ncbi:hypothetical protein H5410_031036 [Solanum commersonii]|uniref:Uncharacterized protein n=1 Tax=Solanum commersonii TaxID=4109 RepID=A0A9J5YH96_SOLCO|nr:hypothetical protein H5410_031036 [Solanum commersonii]